MLLGTGWASTLVVIEGLSPFDSPYAPRSVNRSTQLAQAAFGREQQVLLRFVAHIPNTQAADVFETSITAGGYILATGHEFLPVGGYSGVVPSPTLGQFERDIDEGRVRRVTAATNPLSANPIMRWVVAHCQDTHHGYFDPLSQATFTVYQCQPTAQASRRRV